MKKIFVGQYKNEGYNALCDMVRDELPGVAHTEIIRRRLQGEFADLCTATPEITEIYRPLGFREITPEAKGGFLYCPLGNSPETFEEFCNNYFVAGEEIYEKPENMQFRHELDCLLRFAFANLKEEFTMGIAITLKIIL